jgi:hypothetical protein
MTPEQLARAIYLHLNERESYVGSFGQGGTHVTLDGDFDLVALARAILKALEEAKP